MKTLGANDGAAEMARKEQMKKANKNKPSFRVNCQSGISVPLFA
jgi:hypothetical protein